MIKKLICFIYGHNLYQIKEGQFCCRCGKKFYSEEYFSNLYQMHIQEHQKMNDQ